MKKTKETCISALHVRVNNYNTSRIKLQPISDIIGQFTGQDRKIKFIKFLGEVLKIKKTAHLG